MYPHMGSENQQHVHDLHAQFRSESCKSGYKIRLLSFRTSQHEVVGQQAVATEEPITRCWTLDGSGVLERVCRHELTPKSDS